MATNSKEKPTIKQPLRTYLIDSAKLTEVMRYLMTRNLKPVFQNYWKDLRAIITTMKAGHGNMTA